ncbi:signal transduction histidine kinase [Microbacterium terrae]|uniref:Signal transduction histidine-protein kinase/phosphatase DegS n=1 Tax=Microbacterium terrae TaxID=69369 RepID=A0A0M2GY88_9MICO|nr:histidine kinase [Microbacterium terrae]KJL38735.1 Signal transduction histidine-protein kinase/phosphatase DegS [Microbacterium terrae]MBP1076154.1 signal transduction histidine kinase [Microbacterium terrae]GLJ96974.1 hypothetical protein GCM10017594_01710 [Microbacterium terrae]
MITAMPASTTRARASTATARVVGIVLVAFFALWGLGGIVLFAVSSGGEASTMLALPASETDAALSALGWSSPAVLTVVVVAQTAALVTTTIAAGFILASPHPTVYTTSLAVVMVLFVATGTTAASGWTTALPQSAGVSDAATAVASIAFLALAPLFPTGTPVPRWGTAIAATWLVFGSVSLLVPWWTLGDVWILAGSATALSLVTLTIVAQVLRFRHHSDRTQRQQTKWVLLSLSLFLLSLVPVFITPPGTIDAMSGPGGVAFQIIRGLIFMVLFTLIAVSIALAITRYRLFDVDLVIRRTVVAGTLVLLVGLVYATAVGLAALVWQGSGVVAAVATTIVVAFAAHPVRVRLERAVIRGVYGERGDPYGVVARLSDDMRRLTSTAEIAEHVADVIVGDLRYSGATVDVDVADVVRSFDRGDSTARVVTRIPLVHDGERIGELIVRADAGDTLSAATSRLVESVATQAALGIGAARAAEEVRKSRERILLAREEERRRLHRDLHDGLGPGLAGARQRVEAAVSLQSSHPDASRRLLQEASDAMADLLADVRDLVHGLRPPALDELGLSQAVLLASRPLATGGMPQITVAPAPADLPPAVEVAAFRIALEAMTNAARHANARSIGTTFERTAAALIVAVADDGDGIGDAAPGTGRHSMRERAEELGGSLRVTTRRTGGTLVRAELPLQAEGPE